MFEIVPLTFLILISHKIRPMTRELVSMCGVYFYLEMFPCALLDAHTALIKMCAIHIAREWRVVLFLLGCSWEGVHCGFLDSPGVLWIDCFFDGGTGFETVCSSERS